MAIDTNDQRYQPRTGEFNPIQITDEPHTVEFHSDINATGIKILNGIQLTDPRTVFVDSAATGGPTFSEQTARVAPNSGQFWIDYEASGFTGTAFMEFNAADENEEVLVSYLSLGKMVRVPEPPSVSVQVFTSSGTWIHPAGILSGIKVTNIAAGGGGGATRSGFGFGLGGSGGGGGISIKWIRSGLLDFETVTVGSGGAAGAYGTPPTSGGTGGTSSFGAHCSATGGAGGGAGSNTNGHAGSGGLGGVGSGGDVNSSLGDGTPGMIGHLSDNGNVGVRGGGPGGRGALTDQFGSGSGHAAGTGAGFGGGGGGGAGAPSTASLLNGAPGADGVVIVEIITS